MKMLQILQDIFEGFSTNVCYFIMVLLFMWISKFFKDLSTVGIDDNKELLEKDNVAFGLYTAGFYLAILLGLLGLFIGPESSLIEEIMWFGLYAPTILICVGFNFVLTQKFYLSNIIIMKELLKYNNAVAVFVMGRFVFGGSVLMAAVHGQGNWFTCLSFFLLGEFCCLIGFRFYLWITSYDDIKAIEKNNLSVSLVCLGFLTAMGILLVATLWEGFISYAQCLKNIFWFFTMLILLLLFRCIGPRFLFPKSSLRKEIYEDNNIGAAFITVFFYIILSVIISFTF